MKLLVLLSLRDDPKSDGAREMWKGKDEGREGDQGAGAPLRLSTLTLANTLATPTSSLGLLLAASRAAALSVRQGSITCVHAWRARAGA